MKKIVSIILCVLLICLSSVSVFAAEIDLSDGGKTVFTIDNWTYSVISGSTNLQIEKYIGSDTELYVPRIVNDRMVVAIAENCFSGNKTVKSVVTSSPLWTVGAYAFLNCTSIESFECNFALKEIGGGAFNGASSLKNINLEDSVVTVIRPLTFMSSGIEKVILPETCTEIMSQAFAQCDELTKIMIPNSVTTIHDEAFKSSDNVVIYCYTDSVAHQYAAAHDIPYVLLDAPIESYTFVLGDADGDGYVSIMDATVISRVLAFLIKDEDGKISVRGSLDGEALSTLHATKIARWVAYLNVPEPIGTEVTRDIYPEV